MSCSHFRPVHDFRSLVSPADHAHLLDFVYIESAEKLTEFSAFVDSLGIKKIHGEPVLTSSYASNPCLDWWAHKEMHTWIIPCLVKSQSRLTAEVWDTTPSTTNTNEAQHAWTNSLTGTGLSFAEGLTAYVLISHYNTQTRLISAVARMTLIVMLRMRLS